MPSDIRLLTCLVAAASVFWTARMAPAMPVRVTQNNLRGQDQSGVLSTGLSEQRVYEMNTKQRKNSDDDDDGDDDDDDDDDDSDDSDSDSDSDYDYDYDYDEEEEEDLGKQLSVSEFLNMRVPQMDDGSPSYSLCKLGRFWVRRNFPKNSNFYSDSFWLQHTRRLSAKQSTRKGASASANTGNTAALRLARLANAIATPKSLSHPEKGVEN